MIINMLQAIKEKVENMQEQMGNIGREKLYKLKRNAHNKKFCYRN